MLRAFFKQGASRDVRNVSRSTAKNADPIRMLSGTRAIITESINMDIVNRSRIPEALAQNVARRAGVADARFIVFLDDKVNSIVADAARKNLQDHPNWQYMRPGWEQQATGESDVHACTVSSRIIGSQNLPAAVIDAIAGYDLLVYLDATWTGGGEEGFVATLAHELRHVWQYLNAAIVFHAQTPLSWVMLPQLTPCELDAEKAAKRTLEQMYGDKHASAYLTAAVAGCRPEHREVIERLATIDPKSDPEIEKQTVALLEQHAAEIRKLQREHKFVMPGITEVIELLRGRHNICFEP